MSEFVSMRRLITIGGVAQALARAENITTREALQRLASYAQKDALPGRLFHPGAGATEGPVRVSGSEALARWKQIGDAVTRQRPNRDPIPRNVSSWMIHVEDLQVLADSRVVDPLHRDALAALVEQRARPAKPKTPEGEVPGVRVVRRAGRAETTPMRPVIEEAILRTGMVHSPQSHGSLIGLAWVKMEAMAADPDPKRLAPLVGLSSGGIRYRDGGQTKTYTRKAFAEFLRRRLNKS